MLTLPSSLPVEQTPSAQALTRPHTTNTEISNQVVYSWELVENILLHLPLRDLLLRQIVCRHWRAVAQTSPNIRRALFLEPACDLRIAPHARLILPPTYIEPSTTVGDFVWRPHLAHLEGWWGKLRYRPVFNPFLTRLTASEGKSNTITHQIHDSNPSAVRERLPMPRHMILMHPPTIGMIYGCAKNERQVIVSTPSFPILGTNVGTVCVGDVESGIMAHALQCDKGCRERVQCPRSMWSSWGDQEIDHIGIGETTPGVVNAADHVTGYEMLAEMKKREEVMGIDQQFEEDKHEKNGKSNAAAANAESGENGGDEGEVKREDRDGAEGGGEVGGDDQDEGGEWSVGSVVSD